MNIKAKLMGTMREPKENQNQIKRRPGHAMNFVKCVSLPMLESSVHGSRTGLPVGLPS